VNIEAALERYWEAARPHPAVNEALVKRIMRLSAGNPYQERRAYVGRSIWHHDLRTLHMQWWYRDDWTTGERIQFRRFNIVLHCAHRLVVINRNYRACWPSDITGEYRLVFGDEHSLTMASLL
jgi:hypothetical protein